MTITLKIQDTETTEPQASVSLEISQTLDGNLLIGDHEYLDILIVPKEHKVVTMPKPHAEKDVYDYQKDLMYSLFKGGILDGPVEGGPVFGVVEASYPASANVDPVQAILYQLNDYLIRTAGDEIKAREYDENIEDNFVDPPDSETTAYGEIPPYQDTPGANQVGDPTYTFAGYGYLY